MEVELCFQQNSMDFLFIWKHCTVLYSRQFGQYFDASMIFITYLPVTLFRAAPACVRGAVVSALTQNLGGCWPMVDLPAG